MNNNNNRRRLNAMWSMEQRDRHALASTDVEQGHHLVSFVIGRLILVSKNNSNKYA